MKIDTLPSSGPGKGYLKPCKTLNKKVATTTIILVVVASLFVYLKTSPIRSENKPARADSTIEPQPVEQHHTEELSEFKHPNASLAEPSFHTPDAQIVDQDFDKSLSNSLDNESGMVLKEWQRQHGYHLEKSIRAFFEKDYYNGHQYFTFSQHDLSSLAESGDPDAQILYAVKYYNQEPEVAVAWLKEAAIGSNYTSSHNMLGMHYMNQALEKDEESSMENSYMLDPENDAFVEGLAWYKAAALQGDPIAEMNLMDTYYVEMDTEYQQSIEVRAKEILAELQHERIQRGYPAENTQQANVISTKTLTGSQELASNFTESIDLLELAFDIDRFEQGISEQPRN